MKTVPQRARDRWLDSYVDQLLTRDALTIDAAGINRKTAFAYDRLSGTSSWWTSFQPGPPTV